MDASCQGSYDTLMIDIDGYRCTIGRPEEGCRREGSGRDGEER